MKKKIYIYVIIGINRCHGDHIRTRESLSIACDHQISISKFYHFFVQTVQKKR